MTVSPLTLEDCQEASLLHQAAFFSPWSPETFREFLQTPQTFGLRLREKNKLLGYVLWRDTGNEAEILTFVIAKNVRHTGRGSALLSALTTHLNNHDIPLLFIEVAEDNIAAICFYQKHGFTLLGKRKNYYARANNTHICALTFQKKIV